MDPDAGYLPDPQQVARAGMAILGVSLVAFGCGSYLAMLSCCGGSPTARGSSMP